MAFSRVQGKNHQNGASSSTTVACGASDGLAAISNGSTLMIEVGWASTAGDTVTGITDNTGNTYTLVDLVRNTVQGYSYQTAYRANITNAPQTITATLSASRSFSAITVEEESGISTSSPLDGHTIANQQGPGGGANAVSSGNITPTTNGDYILGVTVNIQGASTFSYGTGYTGRTIYSLTFGDEDLVQGTAAAIAATFTSGSGDVTSGWITAIMAFKAAVAVFTAPQPKTIRQAVHRAAYW